MAESTVVEPPACQWCHRQVKTIQFIDVRFAVRRRYTWCEKCDGPSPVDADQLKSMEKLQREFGK